MARHIWSVLCERVLHDADTQRVSLIDVAEEVGIGGPLPQEENAGVRVDLYLVSYWLREDEGVPELGKVRVDVCGPSGAPPLEGVELDVDLREQSRIQSVGRIDVIPLSGAGNYGFRVNHQPKAGSPWTVVADVPLMIKQTAE